MDMQQDLLEFDHIDVYYITWTRGGRIFYLKDMTPCATTIEWTTDRSVALYFYGEDEARKHVKYIKQTRPKVRIWKDQIELQLEEVDFELP